MCRRTVSGNTCTQCAAYPMHRMRPDEAVPHMILTYTMHNLVYAPHEAVLHIYSIYA